MTQYQLNQLTGAQIDLLPADQPIDPAKGHWWIMHDPDGNRLAGFACLTVTPEGYGYLARSGVYPHYQGKGWQKRLIRVREAAARKLGCTHMVSDTSKDNYPSSNSLIRCGYKLYRPTVPWGAANHWIKKLC